MLSWVAFFVSFLYVTKKYYFFGNAMSHLLTSTDGLLSFQEARRLEGFQAFSRCTVPHCSRALCGHPEASSDAELRGSVGTRRPPQKVRRSVETRSITSCCPPSKRHLPIESAMQFAARRGSRCVESSMILLCERGELARSAEYPRDRSRTRQTLSERLRTISTAEPPSSNAASRVPARSSALARGSNRRSIEGAAQRGWFSPPQFSTDVARCGGLVLLGASVAGHRPCLAPFLRSPLRAE